MTVGCPALAQTSSYDELQSAYLYNFAKYIRWPDEGEIFTIGVLGKADIIQALEAILEGKKVWGARIELKKFNSVDTIPACRIIYLPEASSRNITALKEAVAGKRVLIVSEEDLIRKGAMISFVVEGDRLRFKLKKDALSRAGLIASEGLLKLAILQ